MEVWPNAYYNYIKDSKREYRENKVKIQRRMVEIYHENGGIPGYRMLRDYLAMEGTKISNPTAWKYANELSLRSIVRRKKYEYLGGKKDHIFPNLVNREFKADAPNKVWCTDFTYMKDPETKEKYYNCTIIDLFRREAVATLNGPEITAELAKAALDIAVQQRQPEKGLILHSDYAEEKTMPKNPISVRFFSACILFFGIVFRVNCQSSEKIAFLMSAFFHNFSSSSTFGADLFMASLIISSVANA